MKNLGDQRTFSEVSGIRLRSKNQTMNLDFKAKFELLFAKYFPGDLIVVAWLLEELHRNPVKEFQLKTLPCGR